MQTRFYKPRNLSRLTQAEREFATHADSRALAKRPRTAHTEEAEFDFLDFTVKSRHSVLEDRNLAADSGRWPYQITYSFPSGMRNNIFPVKGGMAEYGASGWSYRMLYDFLCEMYNGGVPFVDTYFKSVFPMRTVHTRFLGIYDTIQADIQDALNNAIFDAVARGENRDLKGRFVKRERPSVREDPIFRQDCASLAEDIRDDIVLCLQTGRIPLFKGGKVSKKTREIREGFGWNNSNLFYASGRLIRHLDIFVEVGRKGGVAA